MEDIIRRYRKEDRNFIRCIAFNTAFSGKSAEFFFDDKEILADFLTLYFTDYEPESCFVAESKGRVVGYLAGAKNIRILRSIFQIMVFPKLLWKMILRGTILKKKNFIFVLHCIKSFLKGEFKMPDYSKGYPATLHINIEENFRNSGVGAKLISAYINYLKEKRIVGVSFSTISEKAGDFFAKQGFNLLHKRKGSYFNYLLHRDIPICIYGKRL